MPINTVIIDDDAGCIKSLNDDLAAYPQVNVVETCTSATKAKKILLKHQPDLLFLDIEMPKMNGIELLNETSPFMHPNMCVVFYSAFDKYMIDALRLPVFDFLLKPYQPDELRLVINRVEEKLHSGNQNFENTIRNLLVSDRKFALHSITGLLLLKRSDILHFRYFNELRYWQLTLNNLSTHKLRLSTTAKEILSISNAFFQLSQDCIVNIDYLVSVENKTLRCIFYPPFNEIEDIYVSRRYYSRLKDTLEVL